MVCESGSKRIIPGKEGVVTEDSSKKLGENLFRAMGLKPNTSRKGYQAQHIIPKSLSKHPVLKKIGMDLDDASNGIFLRERRTGGSSALSRHQGRHNQYNDIIREKLDVMDLSKSSDELQKEVYKLQQAAKKLLEDGTPIYMMDHVPTDNAKLVKLSEKCWGIDGATRTKDFLRRKLLEYGI